MSIWASYSKPFPQHNDRNLNRAKDIDVAEAAGEVRLSMRNAVEDSEYLLSNDQAKWFLDALTWAYHPNDPEEERREKVLGDSLSFINALVKNMVGLAVQDELQRLMAEAFQEARDYLVVEPMTQEEECCGGASGHYAEFRKFLREEDVKTVKIWHNKISFVMNSGETNTIVTSQWSRPKVI